MSRLSRFVFAVVVSAISLWGQDWVPTRIVAITEYPTLAWIAHFTGDVVIKCLLNRDGSVASAEPVSGPGLLKDQARRNAMLWRFRRASRKRTNNYSFTLTYRYKLEGDPEDGRHASFAVDLPGLVDIVAHLPPPMID